MANKSGFTHGNIHGVINLYLLSSLLAVMNYKCIVSDRICIIQNANQYSLASSLVISSLINYTLERGKINNLSSEPAINEMKAVCSLPKAENKCKFGGWSSAITPWVDWVNWVWTNHLIQYARVDKRSMNGCCSFWEIFINGPCLSEYGEESLSLFQ